MVMMNGYHILSIGRCIDRWVWLLIVGWLVGLAIDQSIDRSLVTWPYMITSMTCIGIGWDDRFVLDFEFVYWLNSYGMLDTMECTKSNHLLRLRWSTLVMSLNGLVHWIMTYNDVWMSSHDYILWMYEFMFNLNLDQIRFQFSSEFHLQSHMWSYHNHIPIRQLDQMRWTIEAWLIGI